MPKFRVPLVLLGSSITALAVARHAARLGLPCTLTDHHRGIAFHTRKARHVLLPDDRQSADAALWQLIRGRNLLATSDHWVRWVAAHAKPLAEANVSVLQGPLEVLSLCLDKTRFIHWCQEQGFRTPPLAQPPDFPLIVRPEQTLHHAPHLRVPKAAEIYTLAHYAELMQNYRQAGVVPVVTASLLRGPVTAFSVPVARHPEQGMLSLVIRKVRPTPRYCAAGSYMETCVDEAAEHLARNVVERLGFEGIAEVEILREDETGRDWIIEVNPRPWSQYSMAPAAGYDFLSLTLGRPVVAPSQFTRVRWLDWTGDLYQALSRKGMIARRELTWGKYVRSLLRANCWSTFDLHDLRPFFMDVATLFRR